MRAWALLLIAGCATVSGPAPRLPHIVLFLADDLGWADTGAYGSPTARTPNVDRLAREGLRFTHAFAASPSCAPSRSALYTGLYPARNGAHPNHSAVRPGVRSLPHYLQPLGYRVVLAGKTHIKPRECFPFEVVAFDAQAPDSILAGHDRARPLCLVVAVTDPHVPWPAIDGFDPASVDLPPRSVDTPETRDARARYFTGVERMDRQLGRCLESLRRHGYEDETLFFFSADQGIQWPFAKWNLYDAGIRVPLIARWPGRVAAGGVTEAMVSLVDLLPTFIEVAGGAPPETLDGSSFLEVLLGRKAVHRDTIFAHHTADGKMNDFPSRCIRTATHKLILNLKPQNLYTTHITNHIAYSGRDYWDSWVRKAATDPAAARIVEAYQHRPSVEFYDLREDPHESQPATGGTNVERLKVERLKKNLQSLLEAWMKDQADEGLGLLSGPEPLPNFVLILADDLGWRELGCTGNPFNETPHLDRMAAQGLRFTRAYAAAPVCSPTRAALLTGRHPARLGMTNYLGPKDELHLRPGTPTLVQALKARGYQTGMIGKWHLTGDYEKRRGEPARHGWDEVICSETAYIGSGSYFHPYAFMPGVEARKPGEHLTDRLGEEAADFIRRNREKPFFLYVSHYAPHTRLAGKPEKVEKYRARPGAGRDRNNPELAAMVESLDESVGRVLATLDELKLSERTVVLFTSDNGGESTVTSNAPLRAGKSHLYEGGIRVPLLVRWPGTVRPGTTCDVPVSSVDFSPTVSELAAAGGDWPDGESLVPLLKGSGALRRTALFWHYPLAKPHFLGGRSSGAVRQGDFKLIEFFDSGTVELYDLREDEAEQRDLSASSADRVAELRKALNEWRRRVDAPPASK